MKSQLIASLSAAFLAVALCANAAEAAPNCIPNKTCLGKTTAKVTTKRYMVSKKNGAWVQTATNRSAASVRARQGGRVVQTASNRSLPADRQRVVAIIKSMAPSYGVPTWFALRIAKVESGYNARARGAAGEYGVYQLKCATARGIGFRGNCRALLDPSVNVRYGLKHLSMAVKSSRGNLKLAASKHNGGLGRKSIVRKYVRLVF
jgi:soluble lytic murein transglycosylase-like protein